MGKKAKEHHRDAAKRHQRAAREHDQRPATGSNGVTYCGLATTSGSRSSSAKSRSLSVNAARLRKRGRAEPKRQPKVVSRDSRRSFALQLWLHSQA
jgi:hypothetical protein